MDWIELLGGIAIFIYGLQLANDGLQKRAGDQLRRWLTAFTERRLSGLLSGTLLATVLQSSTATVMMLMGFANTGLLSLSQAMSLLLGAGIGTTVVVQVMSFKLSHLAMLILVIGFAIISLGKRGRTRAVGRAVLGFGLVFLGIQLTSEATAPLQQNTLLLQVIAAFGEQPTLGIAAGAGLTAIVQSSAVTLGLLLSLSFSGLLTLHAALPMVLGANLGNCVMPMLSAVRANVEGKRVAWAYLILRASGVAGGLLLLGPFTTLVSWTAASLPHQIANAHTLFNILLAFLALPFLPWAAALARWVVVVPPDASVSKVHVQYLDEQALETPALAFAQTTREILRMAEMVQRMLAKVMMVFETNDRDLVEDISEADDYVDYLEHHIKLYLTKLSRSALTDEQAARELELIAFTSDLETIGDIVDIDLMHLAKKKIRKGLEFSKEGTEEIRGFHARVMENFELSIAAFTSGDVELARKLLRHKVKIAETAQDLTEAHIQRLHQGLRESIETSSIHLDLLSNLKRINSQLSNIAHPLLMRARHQE
ncbi:MAG: Na/Pi cotransporter family protein [Candidatus Entotheonellia bacterium]